MKKKFFMVFCLLFACVFSVGILSGCAVDITRDEAYEKLDSTINTYKEENEKRNNEIKSIKDELEATNEQLENAKSELETANEQLENIGDELAKLRETMANQPYSQEYIKNSFKNDFIAAGFQKFINTKATVTHHAMEGFKTVDDIKFLISQYDEENETLYLLMDIYNEYKEIRLITKQDESKCYEEKKYTKGCTEPTVTEVALNDPANVLAYDCLTFGFIDDVVGINGVDEMNASLTVFADGTKEYVLSKTIKSNEQGQADENGTYTMVICVKVLFKDGIWLGTDVANVLQDGYGRSVFYDGLTVQVEYGTFEIDASEYLANVTE